MNVRVKDIAEKLGISQATVSLVLNNRRGVSSETRGRVLETAKTMGYNKLNPRRNNIANTIQLLVFKQKNTEGFDTSFFVRMMEGINNSIDRSGYRMMIDYVRAEDDIPQKVQNIYDNGVCGVILLATELNSANIGPLLTIKLPMVILDGYFEELHMDFVTINNVQGAFSATAYLAGKGHTEIGYLASKVRMANFIERKEGFFRAIKRLGIKRQSTYGFSLTPSIDGAYQEMLNYLDNGAKIPTAFFADNDIIAAGVMRALKERNYLIPEDVSIIGFDDIPLCRMMSPELTTVSVPKERMGALAVERLISRIHNRAEEHVKTEVGTTIVVRKSVK